MSHEPRFRTSSYCESGQCVEISFQTSSYCADWSCVEVGFQTSSHCSDGACVEVGFETSSFCSGSHCVEVGNGDTLVYVRDGKDKTGPVLSFDKDAWIGFLDGINHGDFDQ
jgi:hypothetical protein